MKIAKKESHSLSPGPSDRPGRRSPNSSSGRSEDVVHMTTPSQDGINIDIQTAESIRTKNEVEMERRVS